MLSLNTLNVILLSVCKSEAQRGALSGAANSFPFFPWVLDVDQTKLLIHEPITLGRAASVNLGHFQSLLKPQDGAFIRRWCPCTIYFISYERGCKLCPALASGFFSCSLQFCCFPLTLTKWWKVLIQMKRSGQNLAFIFKEIKCWRLAWAEGEGVCWLLSSYLTLINAGSLLESRRWSGRNTLGQQVW